jgi:hypothetical protein
MAKFEIVPLAELLLEVGRSIRRGRASWTTSWRAAWRPRWSA